MPTSVALSASRGAGEGRPEKRPEHRGGLEHSTYKVQNYLRNTGELGKGGQVTYDCMSGGSPVLEVKQLKIGGVDCKRYFSGEAL